MYGFELLGVDSASKMDAFNEIKTKICRRDYKKFDILCFFITRKCPRDHAGGSTHLEGGFFSPLKHTQQLL